MAPLLHRIALLASLTFAASLTGCAAADADDAEDAEAESADVESSEDALSGTRIVPGLSIGGVKLGMTPSEVKSRFGKPTRAYSHPDGRVTTFLYPLSSVEFSLSTGRVKSIFTRSAAFATKGGLGIGSSHKAVDALAGTACRIMRVENEGPEYWPVCVIDGEQAKTTFTFGQVKGPNADLTNATVIQVSIER